MAELQIHEQIKWLEEQLEAKKKELGERGEQKKEREALRDVIQDVAREHIAPPTPLATHSVIADDNATALKEKEHEHIINELIQIAITKNLFVALSLANKLRNPHLVDDFHDALADHYYEKLMEARKLKQ